LITSGGKAPGPQPLKDCIHNIRKILNRAIEERGAGTTIQPIEAHDICCYIADCVLSGGIRRAALISLFSFDDENMLTCKYGNFNEANPQRERANNSVVLLRHRITEDDFKHLWKKIEASKRGEPGVFFTNDKELLTNPCCEISLKSCGFCNLTTINVNNIQDQEELEKRVKAAAFIGTLQASYTDFHYLRDIWKKIAEKEALLGVSMTGIAGSKVMELDLEKAAKIAVEENKRVAKLIGINSAARVTCIKPEGCQKKETMVSTKEGILSLEEIGDIESDKIWQDHDFKVYTDNGEKQSTKFFKNGLAKTKKILTDGGIELESTHNHMYRVLTEEGSYEWKRVDELEEGMMLPYSIGEYDGGSIQKLKQVASIHSNQKTIRQPHNLSSNLAWFLGLYFGDGSNHKKGIRIHGNFNEQKGFDKLKEVVNDLFDLSTKIHRHPANDGRCSVYINSTMLLSYLGANGLLKEKSDSINIPEIIRRSPKDIIESFIDGYATADGCCRSTTRSFCTTSKTMAEQLVVVLRAIGKDCKMRLMPPTESSFGTKMRYWIQERKGRLANPLKIRKYMKNAYRDLSEKGLDHLSIDTIVSISDGECKTYDIEINDEKHTYLANSYVSHNTASCVVGSSSGIHAWHWDYFIRRMRVGKTEPLYKYLKSTIPELVEDELFKPNLQAVISIPMKAPDGAILRTESPIDLLNRAKFFHKNWIKPGHIDGQNTHNVSITVTIKDDEWESVGKWMWDNRYSYNGIAVFPFDGGMYAQAPFEDCTKEKYEELLQYVKKIDLTKIKEDEDNTSHKDVAACAGGACEISHV
jgi:intein/homing endonuclease